MSKKMKDQEILVKCPFYLREDTFTVTCEGLSKDAALRQWFKHKATKEEWHQQYCEKNYKDCPIFKIINSKYQ